MPALAATLPEAAELIVSDDGLSDGSAEGASRLGARVVTSAASTGPAAARKRAAPEAAGDVLVFVDTACTLTPWPGHGAARSRSASPCRPCQNAGQLP